MIIIIFFFSLFFFFFFFFFFVVVVSCTRLKSQKSLQPMELTSKKTVFRHRWLSITNTFLLSEELILKKKWTSTNVFFKQKVWAVICFTVVNELPRTFFFFF